jgi:alpha-beta hydrolase superfamily lysophospholipase
MTTTTTDAEAPLLKTDALGRVRTPAARRERLLDEFERSGLSGVRFAELTGLKYQTLASWMQRRRRRRDASAPVPAAQNPTATVRWLEAVVAQSASPAEDGGSTLPVQLPGGARLEIARLDQVPLAAALLRALEKAGTC